MGIYASCRHFSIIVWLQHQEFKKAFSEKDWWKRHKDTACWFEQILKQHLSKQWLYHHLSPISLLINEWQTRHAGLSWRRNKLIWASTKRNKYCPSSKNFWYLLTLGTVWNTRQKWWTIGTEAVESVQSAQIGDVNNYTTGKKFWDGLHFLKIS